MSDFSFDAGSGDFQERVIASSDKVPVLVDFWAGWCAPCKALKPVLEKLAAEYGGRFLLAKVDTDANPELAARYAVRGIPAVKAFRDGKVVDEFTGALPEARVRAFVDGLLPSPAEPLRIAAQAARANGEAEVACSLLADAIALDPASELLHLDLAEIRIDMGQTAAAQALLDSLPPDGREARRTAALAARLKLAAAGGGADRTDLEARIAANGDDFDARLRLAGALALAHDHRAALEQLLELVRRDRKWNDEAARKAMLDLFTVLAADPRHDDLLREFRIRLARTLN